jgi:hypothetical protein
MSSVSEPNEKDDGLEAAVDQAIAACDGDMRSTIRALIVANEFLESEVGALAFIEHPGLLALGDRAKVRKPGEKPRQRRSSRTEQGLECTVLVMTGLFSDAAPVITMQIFEAGGLVDRCQVCGMGSAVRFDQLKYGIDAWRDERNIATRPEAIRRLVELGLKSKGK